MKKTLLILAALMLVASFVVAQTAPKQPKTYQATGPIVTLTDDVITIDKGKEGKWEVARNKETKVTGELKVGEKVTVMYRMVAESVEVKAEKAKAPAKK